MNDVAPALQASRSGPRDAAVRSGLEGDLVRLLATVTADQRAQTRSRLPRYRPDIADKERRRIFEHETVGQLARLMIQKAEWEKLFTLPDAADCELPDEVMEQWACGFVVMTQGQLNALTSMVMALIRRRELDTLADRRNEDRSESDAGAEPPMERTYDDERVCRPD